MLRIWNGIDVDRFEFVGAQPELSAVSVARLSPEKDFGTLLRATAIVLREFPQFRLRIVGDGRERGALERLSAELGLTSVVEFMGERSNVPALLATAGFFVSSSRTEGISLTVLEAMSVGLPVVTTAVGGSPEIVVEGTTGWLAPAEDPQALAHAITRMCRARSHWMEMGRAARERVEEHFNIRSTMAHYETLYEQALQKKQR
jgi:glycosyltransferase involved in cell wall biosynthesis